MKKSQKLYKKYRSKRTEQSLYDFFIEVLHEYISHVTGMEHIRISTLGIKTREDSDNWVRNDDKLHQWLIKEFNIVLTFNGNDFVITDIDDLDNLVSSLEKEK